MLERQKKRPPDFTRSSLPEHSRYPEQDVTPTFRRHTGGFIASNIKLGALLRIPACRFAPSLLLKPEKNMPPIDFTSPKKGRISYSYENFSKAKMFFFGKWCQVASTRKLIKPTDLSSSCKYGSLFTQNIFGGAVRGNYEHQFNVIDGRRVDLSHDSLDVGRMSNPYLHEQSYFEVPETRASLAGCSSRAEEWASEFMETMADEQ